MVCLLQSEQVRHALWSIMFENGSLHKQRPATSCTVPRPVSTQCPLNRFSLSMMRRVQPTFREPSTSPHRCSRTKQESPKRSEPARAMDGNSTARISFKEQRNSSDPHTQEI